MNRRAFFRNAALIAAGAVAADQLELIDRLGWKRKLFSAWGAMPVLYGDGVTDDTRALNAWVRGLPVYDEQERSIVHVAGRHSLIAREFKITPPLFGSIVSPIPYPRELSYCILRPGPRYTQSWETSPWYDNAVAEAKRRGMTPHFPSWMGAHSGLTA